MSANTAFLCAKSTHAQETNADVNALMERARVWYARDQLDKAREALDHLFRFDANHANGLAMLAEIELHDEQIERAKSILNQLRTADPAHPAIKRIETLLRLAGPDRDKLHQAQLLARSGQTQAAVSAFRELYPDGPPGGDFALEYWQLVGRTENGWKTARRGLAQLTKEQPENLRYRLALAEHDLSRHPNNKKALRTVLRLAKRPQLAREAQAAWRSAVMRMDDTEESILWLQDYVAQAPTDTGAKDRLLEMQRAVEEQRQLLADPAYQLGRQGLVLLESGDLANAEAYLEESLKQQPNDVEVAGGMGYLRLRQGRHDEAQAYFERAVELDVSKDSKWVNLARTAEYWGLLRRSKDALATQDPGIAESYARAAVHADATNPSAFIALGRAQYSAGDKQKAEETWQTAIGLAQSGTEKSEITEEVVAARTSLMRKEAAQLVSSGNIQEAIRLLEKVVEVDQNDPWLRLDLAELLDQQGSTDEGHRIMLAQVTNHPTDPDSLYALALYQSHAGLVREANETLAKVPAADRSESMIRMQQRLENRIAILDEQQAKWLSGGLDWRYRKGSVGTSRMNAVVLPMEYKSPYKKGDIYLRADLISMDSGEIDLARATDARTFGSVLVCQPGCDTGSYEQKDRGVALTMGYEWPQWRIDVGTSPRGFAVVRPVGGLRHRGDLGKFSYTLDFASRPMTSSFLSYAGTTDPRSGAVWGGVQTTGLNATISRDEGGTLGAWALASVHRLTGENVLSNDRIRGMIGAYWRIINETDRLFSAGVTGMAWRYSDNAGEFTFGHGGYFSPSSYQSVSLPVTFGKRTAKSSYTIRAAISHSDTKVDSAPYYPTDPLLQTEAEARAGITGVNPYYDESYGGGLGYTFEAIAEHRIDPTLLLGSHLQIEKSDDYEPHRLLIYLRYSFDHMSSRAMMFPPRPYLPTEDY